MEIIDFLFLVGYDVYPFFFVVNREHKQLKAPQKREMSGDDNNTVGYLYTRAHFSDVFAEIFRNKCGKCVQLRQQSN